MISFDFQGKVFAATGAAGGLMQSTARLFLKSGASLALADTDHDALERFADDLDPSRDRILTARVDVTDSSQCDAFAFQTQDRFGGVDILVPGAGVSRHSDYGETADADWRRTLGINVDGVFYTIRAFGPMLRDGGAIVNISSMAANRGPDRNAAYGASKGAVVSMTRALCREFAPRVRVNAVSPGPVQTNMLATSGAAARLEDIMADMPLGRLGRPEEIAAAVAYLASDAASFITGEILHVNGGYVMGG